MAVCEACGIQYRPRRGRPPICRLCGERDEVADRIVDLWLEKQKLEENHHD
jgi:hypothetical protein